MWKYPLKHLLKISIEKEYNNDLNEKRKSTDAYTEIRYHRCENYHKKI